MDLTERLIALDSETDARREFDRESATYGSVLHPTAQAESLLRERSSVVTVEAFADLRLALTNYTRRINQGDREALRREARKSLAEAMSKRNSRSIAEYASVVVLELISDFAREVDVIRPGLSEHPLFRRALSIFRGECMASLYVAYPRIAHDTEVSFADYFVEWREMYSGREVRHG